MSAVRCQENGRVSVRSYTRHHRVAGIFSAVSTIRKDAVSDRGPMTAFLLRQARRIRIGSLPVFAEIICLALKNGRNSALFLRRILFSRML